MTSSLAHDLTAFLHQQGRLRVWSIIVTIMGDVVETTGGTISIAELIDICTNLDIEPQAVRTAMSRLTKEGWVERIPDGRSTQYRFSDHRRGEFNDAASYIYARPEKEPKDWMVGVLPPWSQAKKQTLIKAMAGVHPIIINQQMAVWAQDYDHALADECRQVLTIFNSLPASMGQDVMSHIAPPPQDVLIGQLSEFGRNVIELEEMTAKDALIVRIILMHFWRRLVLRHIPIHSPFDEALWPLPSFHTIMAELYPKLAERSAAFITGEIDSSIIASRFNRPAEHR